MAIAACIEAAVAALIIRWAYRRFGTFASLRATGAIYAAGGIVGPLASAGPAMAGFYAATGHGSWANFGGWMLAHGLGFIATFPCVGLIVQAQADRRAIIPPPGQRLLPASFLIAMVAASAVCFGQSAVPMLFLPVIVLMYTMALTDIVIAVIGLTIVLVMGVGSAFLGFGPLKQIAGATAHSYLLVQFYVAFLSLTAMPIAIVLEKRRRLFSALAQSETRYRMLADFSTDIIMVTDLDGKISYVSPSIHQLGDWDPAELIGTATWSLISEQHHADVVKAHMAVVNSPGTTASVEFLGITRGQGKRWFESHLRAIQGEDGILHGVCSVVRDISNRKRTEAELQAVALTDPLTNLANRRAFELFIGNERRTGESYLALFDIDRFRRINETYGHQAGDDVIKSFARAIRATLRDSDLAARIGGGEFVVHLHNSSLAQAQIVCERVRAAFTEEVERRVPGIGSITASVGLSHFDAPLAIVMRRADTALYQAKATASDCLAVAA
ncbi:MAG: diguanylate cyclase [Novosphingobium sp.]|nr:diguanylate cyclase [Novosphingobium sp.]